MISSTDRASQALRAARSAAVVQLGAAAYLQFIEWVPLFPWNDLSRGNGQEELDVAIAVLTLVLVMGTWRMSRVAIIGAVAGYGAWLVLQIQSWWIPYLAGASPEWRSTYNVWFGRTVKFLPSIGDHPVPDAAHVVLQLLLAAAVAMSVRALIVRRVRGGLSTPQMDI